MLAFAAVYGGEQNSAQSELINEALFYRIAQGDCEAFCELYEVSRGAVFAYSLSILQNREDADDATQDTFLKIRSAAHLYRAQGKPMAWILTIAKNTCLMQLRQKKHRKTISLETLQHAIGSDEISDREDRILLEQAFRVLSETELRIIILHALSGMKHREIAELLQIPLSTVLSRYNRGIAKLRRRLEEVL